MKKIEHYTLREMGGLIDVLHLSFLTSVSTARIEELVKLLLIPHVRIDGGPPLFKKSEALRWIKDNLVVRSDGQPLPVHFTVNTIVKAEEDLPIELQGMRGRVYSGLSDIGVNTPCVYFLINNGCIVYIGQSVALATRLVEHRSSGKAWSRVVWIPCPPEHLSHVEQWWIRHVRPPLNSQKEIKSYEISPPLHLIKESV